MKDAQPFLVKNAFFEKNFGGVVAGISSADPNITRGSSKQNKAGSAVFYGYTCTFKSKAFDVALD